MMETPKEKVLGYLVVSIVIVAILLFVVGLVLGAIFAVGRLPVL